MPSWLALGAITLQSLRLLEATDDRPVPVEGATWIQIAAEGQYKGHPSGTFELTQKVFDEIIGNFHDHPSFELDEATGLGKEGVVAFDFHHASEEPAAMVGVSGAPAQAWALDLETRKGPKGCELWALTQWLEPARSYVQAGKYKWTSVAIWPNAPHPVTGENMGYYLSSIAFTNDPFIQGMQAIAAQRSGTTVVLTAQHLFDELKYCMGLPETAGAAEVAAELAKLRQMAQPGAAPPAGVDVEGLLGRVRNLLNLPKLADASQVFAEVDKLMGAVAATPPEPVQPGISEPPPMTTAATAAARKGTTMKKALLRLARKIGIDFDEADLDDEVKVQVLAQRVAEAACLKLGDAEKATKAISAIAKALGVKDGDEAVARLTEMMGAFGDITAAMPGLASIMEGQAANQDEEMEDDVQAAARQRGWGDDVVMMARQTRSGGVDFPQRDPKRQLTVQAFLDEVKEHQALMAKRTAARDAFRRQFPADKADTPDYLTTQLATRRVTGQPIMADRKPQAPPALPGGIDLDSLPGANLVQKCEAHIRKQNPDLSYDEINEQAVMLSRKLRPMVPAN